MKPWKWWTYPLFDLNWHWVELRDHLQPFTDSPMNILFAAAASLVLLAVVSGLRYFNVLKPTRLAILKHDSIVLSTIVALMFPLSCLIGFYSVPSSMHPHFAILLFCLWTIFFLCLFCFCVYVFTSTSQVCESPFFFSIILIGVLLFMSLVVPLYIKSFFARVCVFLMLILLTFVCSHIIIRRCLLQTSVRTS